MNRSNRAIGLALSALTLAAVNQATAITYTDFSSVAGLTLNGNTAQSGNVLRLTPASIDQSGSAFSTTTVALNNLSSFSTRFQFRITASGGIGDDDGIGADGIVFVVQTVANTAGGAGGGIGYDGLSPSVGVEFDTYNNGTQDGGNGNHVGIDLNGNMSSDARQAISPRFNDANIWTAWVDYNGNSTALEVRLNQTGVRPLAANLAYNVDLASVLGTDAFVGFSAGTGGGWGNQDILNWDFESDYNPIGSVPDAGSSFMLLTFSCLGLGFWSRRVATKQS